MNTNKKVAIIGLGNIGQAVAGNLAKSSRSFIVAGRDHAKVEAVAAQWGLAVEVAPSIDTAIKQADLILLSIPYGEIAPLIQAHAEALRGKIVIDPSNAIAPLPEGGFKKVIGEEESAGELIGASLPEGIRLVKAFGTLGAQSLSEGAFAEPRKVLFYASNCPSVQEDIDALINDAGFAPLYLGGMEHSIRLEVFGSLHEFGALGKTVTLDEAKAVL